MAVGSTRYTPPWIDKIRFIAFYVFNSCEAPYGLYIQMAKPTAKEIFLVFTSLSVKDIVKEFFRPKGLRSKRHGRKGWKNKKGWNGIPDPNEMIAKRLVENTEFNRRRYGMPTQIFYVIDDVIDRVTWTVCLFEMSADLIYESMLGVMEHEGHLCGQIRRLASHGTFQTEGGVGSNWEPVGLGVLRYSVGIAWGGINTFFLPTGTFSCTFGCRIYNGSATQDIQLRWNYEVGGVDTFSETDWLTVEQGESKDLILNQVIQGPVFVAMEGRETGSFWNILESDCMILEII